MESNKYKVTPEQAPGFTSRERQRIASLWRRITFLENRIANYYGEGSPSRDMAELAAIKWVMREAGLPFPPPTEPSDVSKNN